MKPQNRSATSQNWADCWVDASRDLAHAHHVLDAGLDQWAAFSACRAAERAFTAVILGLGLDVDVRGPVALAQKLAGEIAIPADVAEAAGRLARFRMTTRIGEFRRTSPAALPEAIIDTTDADPDAATTGEALNEAGLAVALADRIGQFCRAHLPR
jgi:HEPN domain-containing protein